MITVVIWQFSSDTTISMVMLPKLESKLQKLEEKLTNLNVQIDSVSKMYQFVRISIMIWQYFFFQLQDRHQADIWQLVEQKVTVLQVMTKCFHSDITRLPRLHQI